MLAHVEHVPELQKEYLFQIQTQPGHATDEAKPSLYIIRLGFQIHQFTHREKKERHSVMMLTPIFTMVCIYDTNLEVIFSQFCCLFNFICKKNVQIWTVLFSCLRNPKFLIFVIDHEAMIWSCAFICCMICRFFMSSVKSGLHWDYDISESFCI